MMNRLPIGQSCTLSAAALAALLAVAPTAGAQTAAASPPAGSAQPAYAISDTQLQSSVSTALGNDPKLKDFAVKASANAGVVTLTGSVPNEDARTEAEQVAAGVSGVRSIQDNVDVGDAATPAAPAALAPSAPGTDASAAVPEPAPAPAVSDGSAGPAPTAAEQAPAQPQLAQGSMPPPPPPDAQDQPQNQAQAQASPQTYPQLSPQSPAYGGSPNGNYPGQAQGYPQQAPPPSAYGDAGQSYPNGNYPGQNYPAEAGGYPQQGDGYGAYGGYGPRGNAHPPVAAGALAVPPQQQNASGPIVLPAGTLLAVRTAGPLSTGNLAGGEYFQVTAAQSLYVGGVVAIPRGAVLTGQVVAAKNAGPLGGSPRLELRLLTLQLGGLAYPVVTDTWSNQGPSKTGYTATNTVGGAALGALIGAAAGGGVGAGVGAIAGGAAGVAVSGATHGPRLDLPPEALLQFHIEQPLTLQPVSYDEAARLAAAAPQPPELQQRPLRPVYISPYPYMARPYPYYYSRY